MPTADETRADNSTVVEILSKAYSVTLPADADAVPEPIYPEKVDRLGFPLAELQEVMWETYPGLHGTKTLLKKVEYTTTMCDECGGEGWIDYHGDTICDDCGMVLSRTPMMVPEGGDHNGGPTAGISNYVFFNDGSGKAALNQNTFSGDEPDVQ